MSKDTERALEIIKPIADELNIEISADDKILYVNDMGIGISCNSTYATVMEFIGYLIAVKYDPKFRLVGLTDKQRGQIKRYWLSSAQLSKLKDGEQT